MLLENYAVRLIDRLPIGGLTGRRKILSPVRAVTAENVVEVLNKALAVHSINAGEITYLYNYYKGVQDIRFKKKIVRENINEQVCVNRANEIVTFKSAFLLEEPIQYISHGGNDQVSKLVQTLNDYMRMADKEASDKEIVDWLHICGVGERIALRPSEDSDAPFAQFSLDPRTAFVVYHDGIGERPLVGFVLGVDEDGERIADAYTPAQHFLIKGDKVLQAEGHLYGGVPLVEYLHNEARMGAFEQVISILNNINLLESNAVDSIEDFVNGFDVFQNCDIDDGAYSDLAIGGKAVKIKTVVQGMEAKVYRVYSELNQSGVQTRVDDLTGAYLEICGMPNRNGGSSTSDTGTATIYRDGWATAVSRAKDTETLFRRSEKQFCRIVLNICREKGIEVPGIQEFEPEFLAHKLSNLQSKVQSLCEMLANDKIHPQNAYAAAGVFDDNEAAYRAGMEWFKAQTEEKERRLNESLDRERNRINSGTESDE